MSRVAAVLALLAAVVCVALLAVSQIVQGGTCGAAEGGGTCDTTAGQVGLGAAAIVLAGIAAAALLRGR